MRKLIVIISVAAIISIFMFSSCIGRGSSESTESSVSSSQSEINSSQRPAIEDSDTHTDETSVLVENKEQSSSTVSISNEQSSQNLASQPSSSVPPPVAENKIAASLLSDASGSAGVSLIISSSQGVYKELNNADAKAFLEKIDFSSFVEAKAKSDISLPDGMGGEAKGNYIAIGMPHTSTLYIFEDYSQAVINDANGKLYYDVPSDSYGIIDNLL